MSGQLSCRYHKPMLCTSVNFSHFPIPDDYNTAVIAACLSFGFLIRYCLKQQTCWICQTFQKSTNLKLASFQVLVLVLTGSILLCFFILSSLVNTPLVSLWHAVYNAIIMESPLHMSADIARVEDLYRRFDLVRFIL